MSNSQPIHLQFTSLKISGISSSIPIQHFSDVTTLSSMHPTQKFVRRHQHDLTSARVRTPADFCVSPLARHSRATVGSEDAAALGASCSNRTVFLNLSGWSSPVASDPLLPTWMSLILPSSCWFPLDVTARCVRLSNRHLLIISVFTGTIRTSPAPRSTRALFFSLTRSVSVILSLYALILAFPVKVLSMIVLIRSRQSSLCGFVAFPSAMQALRILGSLQCVRELQCPQTRRRIFWVQPLALFQPQSLCNGGPAPSLSAVTFFVNFNSGAHHLPRSATQTYIVVSLLSTFASHNSILGDCTKTAPVRS